MPPSERRDVDDDDPTRQHLEAALESATDDAVRFHVRQALQHHLIADDTDQTTERDRS